MFKIQNKRPVQINQIRSAVAGSGILTVILLLTLVSGCPSPPAAPLPPEVGVTDVTIRGFAFIPKEVTIHKGEKVRWTNLEPQEISHTATSGNPGDNDTGVLWDSGLLVPGEFFAHQFNEVGTFVYFCRPHAPIMRNAKVIVVP